MKIKALTEAEAAYEEAVAKLAPVREEIRELEAKLARLRDEHARKLEVYCTAVREADAEQNITLTPWISADGSFCRYIERRDGREWDKCWDRRAWLRSASFVDGKWVLDYGSYNLLDGAQSGRVMVGPPDLKVDRARELANEVLLKAGWILPDVDPLLVMTTAHKGRTHEVA